MGRVWRATDVVLHRDVAIKELVPPPGLTPGERQEMRERSLREARAIARLNNINVVRVFDVLRTDADPWIVMEYVASRSLQDTLASDGPFNPLRAAEIGLGVLGALRAAHRAGVVHRDVKPGNVLLGADGRVVLTDFGLATVPGDPNVTRTGLVLGSPAYIAPERARDGTSGPAADLWSLGATLYAAVEGASPFARPSAIATLAALATENPPPARNAGPLKPVLNGLLRKDPTHRINLDEAERLLTRAAGRRSKLAFPMSPTMRRPGVGRDRSAGGLMAPTGATPVVPGPRPPIAPARSADPPGRPPVSGGRPAAGEGRPPIFAPGKAPVGRPPARPVAETPTKVDGPKVDAPRLDATRVDTPPVRDDKTTVMGTRGAPATAPGQPPASRQTRPGAPATPPTRTGRGELGGLTASDVAAHRRRQAAPEHEQSLADATALVTNVKPPAKDKPADATTVVGPIDPAADATTVVGTPPRTTRPAVTKQPPAKSSPAEKPAEKPVEKSAEKSAEKLLEEPAAAAVATAAATGADTSEKSDVADEASAADQASTTAKTSAPEETERAADTGSAGTGNAAAAKADTGDAGTDNAAAAGNTAGTGTGTGTGTGNAAAAKADNGDAGTDNAAAAGAAAGNTTGCGTGNAAAAGNTPGTGTGTGNTAAGNTAGTRNAAAGNADTGDAGTGNAAASGNTAAGNIAGTGNAAADDTAGTRNAAAGNVDSAAAGTGNAAAAAAAAASAAAAGNAAGVDNAAAAGIVNVGESTAEDAEASPAEPATEAAATSDADAAVDSRGGAAATDATAESEADAEPDVEKAAVPTAEATDEAVPATTATEEAESEEAESEEDEERAARVQVPLARRGKPARASEPTPVAGPAPTAEPLKPAAEPETPDNSAPVLPLAPISRPTRPAWRPMEVGPSPRGGVTVFGTRLTWPQAGIGAAALLVVLILVIVLVAQAFGGGTPTTPQGGPATADPRPSTGASAAQPAGTTATTATPPSSASTPSSPAASSAGAFRLPAGWKMYTQGASGGAPGFSIPVPNGVKPSFSGGSEIQLRWNNRLLIIDRSGKPQADALQDTKKQEASRKGGYRDYSYIGIKPVKYRDFDSVADWEFLYTTERGNAQHAVKRNMRVDAKHAYMISWYTTPEDWDDSQSDLQLLYQGFQPK